MLRKHGDKEMLVSTKETTFERADFYAGCFELSRSGHAQPIS